jgi:hypothetical protein
MTDDERAAAAYERGLERGKNDERENYYNESPLSGEWAGESIFELLGDLLGGYSAPESPNLVGESDDWQWISEEYERGYRDAFTDRSFCDECGTLVNGNDGATDDVLVFCGSFYGNGCGDRLAV